jgi:hypothetical protein
MIVMPLLGHAVGTRALRLRSDVREWDARSQPRGGEYAR